MTATDRQIRWLNQLEEMLTREEQQLIEDLQLLIGEVVDRIEGLVEALPEGSPSRDIAWLAAQPELEQPLGRLNDKLRSELGRSLQGLQKALRQHASTLAPGDTDAPYRTAGELLKRSRMADASVHDWLLRRSPSRWMTNLQNSIGNAVRAGWQRDAAGRELAREVASAATTLIASAIETLTRTSLWDFSNQETSEVWEERRRWRYLAILDPKLCGLCAPWAGVEGTIDEIPSPPLHPRCRCYRVPVAG